MRIAFFAALGAGVLMLSACASAPPLPKETGPNSFIIEQRLAGKSTARGEFRAITGVRRPFTAYLSGTWDGAMFVLEEDFVFDDGQKDRKTWRLKRTGDGQYSGTREDVVGEATGFQDGRAFRLEYDVRLPKKDGTPGRKVHFRDVMVETPEGVVINRATVGLWGLRVGSVDLRITPQS
ncbi:MAG: DUF3833 family protein [Caulobacterales bacterium]